MREGLNRLLRAGSDLSPVMRAIAGHLADSVEESFEQESAPDGTPWQPLSAVTLAERTKRGYVPARILRRTSALLSSILADWGKTSAIAGTNLVYATTHQFGAKKGEFGKGAPWGDIPARPFLGVWPEHRDDIKQDVLAFISGAWKP